MKPVLILLGLLSFILPTTYAGMDTNIIDIEPPFSMKQNCAYKKKVASRKCTVSTAWIKPDHPYTKAFFGDEEHIVLTIAWPDGDVSRYALGDSRELTNLNNGLNYRFKVREDDEGELDTNNGVIILYGDEEHIRLW